MHLSIPLGIYIVLIRLAKHKKLAEQNIDQDMVGFIHVTIYEVGGGLQL